MSNTLTLKDSELAESTISFHNKKGIAVGRFIIEGENLKFEGNPDKAAKIFVELVLKRFIDKIKKK
jgi:peptide subunit release factor RF-3